MDYVEALVTFIVEGIAGKYKQDQEHAWLENFYANTAAKTLAAVAWAIKENSLLEQTGVLEGLVKRVDRVPTENADYLDRVIDDLLEVTSVLRTHIEKDIHFGATKVYDTYRKGILLLIACYTTDIVKFHNHESYEFMATHGFNELMKTHHDVEVYLYQYYKDTHEIMNSIRRGDTPRYLENYRFRIEHDVNVKLTDMYKTRRLLERARYIHHLNRYGNLEHESALASFSFYRCMNPAPAKERLRDASGQEYDNRFLTANNVGGTMQNPSVIRELYGIPEKANVECTVDLSSQKSGRTAEFVIWELEAGHRVNKVPAENEYLSLDSAWKSVARTFTKHKEHSLLRLEAYWHDNEKEPVQVDNMLVTYEVPDKPLPEVAKPHYLPVMSLHSWHPNCSGFRLAHELSETYPTTQVLHANDARSASSSPSIFQDVELNDPYEGWKRLNVAFEANLRTERAIGRKVRVGIKELNNVQDRAVIHEEWSDEIELTDEWIKFQMNYDRKSNSLIRIEITWSDHDAADLILRDADVSYFLD